MQSLEAIKRKIESAEDLAAVVGTMKTLAAVSIRQYESAVLSLADYYATVEDGLRMVLWQAADISAPAVTETDGEIGAIVFGSDQGMCGQFNEQIVRYAIDRMRNGRQAPHDRIDPVRSPALAAGSAAGRNAGGWAFLAVGARVTGRLEDAGLRVDRELSVPGSATGITPLVHDLLRMIDEWRSRRKLGRIVLFYNRRQSAAAYVPHHWQLLPIPRERFERLKERRWPSRTLPRITMHRSRLLSVLIRQFLFVSLFRACAESLAGENASRIASMQAAQRNIEDRLAGLRSEYNLLRQTSITEELLDVVTGFEALTQGSDNEDRNS